MDSQPPGREHVADLVCGAHNPGGVLLHVGGACDCHYGDDITGRVENGGADGVDSLNHFAVRDKVPLFLDVLKGASVDSLPCAVQVPPPGLGRQVRKNESSHPA